MSYVPRPLSEIARMQPGPMDWDAMHDLGSQDIPRDHYLLGTLRPALRLQTSSVGSYESDTEPSSPAQVILLACGLGPVIEHRHPSYDAVEQAAQNISQQFHGLTADQGVDLGAVFAATQQRMRQLPRSRYREAFGCSMAAAVVRWPHLQLAHAGDIRCFLYTRSRLHLLSSIHTLGARLSQPGSDDVWALPTWGDVLWNAITPLGRDVEPELVDVRLTYGDALVLCTAPIAHTVSPRRIATLLREDRPAGETACRLLDLAKNGGCRNEATVVVARFRSPERWQLMPPDVGMRATSMRPPPRSANGEGASGRSQPGFNEP